MFPALDNLKTFYVVRIASIVALREIAFHLSGEIAMFYHVLRVINLEITWVHDLPVFELSLTTLTSKCWSKQRL